MSVTGYLYDHWGLLVIVIGIAIIIHSDIHLERRMTFRILLTIMMLFGYSVSCHVESYLAEQAEYTILRPILSALNYSLIAFILVNIVMIVYPMQKLYLYIPALLNAALCFISIPTGIVFYISEDNHFGRGMLGYLTYFICALYLIYLICNLFKNKTYQKEDIHLLVFMSVTSVMCLVMPLIMDSMTEHWFNVTIAIDLLLYYVFLLQQFTKRDPLTKLLNRQSYYADAEKMWDHITAIVTMDMDGLKTLNDSEGHTAGDTALKALADCFRKASQRSQRVYRIGGDEYVILCIGSSESEVKALVGRIKQEVAKTPYTCSVGYAMKEKNNTIDDMYNSADSMLYVEKEQFYITSGKERRKQ
ncbi:diguanylate cyclase (GGDEF) domain-containing protein [Ruminococcus sp. YRD2003]|uniref:GGDEF domain-containing protein n=1 Tax=Ruminococcus sp. YRD2003 TaxID=1452313 RepID=UPI0008AEF5E3|nr:diguanylate cyclase (GGDEF) domain-containing protein [Ruminococcus flavefaciens]